MSNAYPLAAERKLNVLRPLSRGILVLFKCSIKIQQFQWKGTKILETKKPKTIEKIFWRLKRKHQECDILEDESNGTIAEIQTSVEIICQYNVPPK